MTRLMACFSFLILVGYGCGSDDGGPSQEDQEKLEDLWKNPGKADLVLFGTAYKSEYTNMGVTGRARLDPDSDYVDFTMFAGWHTNDFPWPDAKSWASIGLRIGDAGYNYVAYRPDGFAITSLPDQPFIDFTASFQGAMQDIFGNDVPVEFELLLNADIFNEWMLGISDLGLKYRPAVLAQIVGVTNGNNTYLKIGDTTYEIDLESIFGQVEQGYVFGINYRGAYYKYDYCTLLNPEDGKSFTSFTTKTLTQEGNPILEKASEFLAGSMSKAFTLDRNRDYTDHTDLPCVDGCYPDWTYEPGEDNPDNPEGVKCPEYGTEGVLFDHLVDLGKHCALKRQMFRTTSASGKEYTGLREIFLPKTNVWGKQCEPTYCGDLPETE